VNSRSYNSPGQHRDCSSPSNTSANVETVHQTSAARSSCDVDIRSTHQQSSLVPDRQRPINNGHHQLARPTGLVRSTSERTSRPSHQAGVNQSGMSRSVHVVSSPSARRTTESTTFGRVLSPLSHQPHPMTTTTTTSSSNDVPWWWTAAERTVAANAGRSSTLPRTVRDSVELTSPLVLPDGGAVLRGISVGGNNAVDRKDKYMERRRISMGSESYRQMALSPSAQMTSKTSSDGTGSIRAVKEETHRESSALTVISMDVNGRCRNDKQKPAHQTSSPVTGQDLAVQATPSTGSSSAMPSSSMPVLTPRQLCADGERLSNYRKLSDDPNIKLRHNVSLYPRDTTTMTSSKSTNLSTSISSSSSSAGGDGSGICVSAPSQRFRERWLGSDGSSTENVPSLCVEATKSVDSCREAVVKYKSSSRTTGATSSDRSSSKQNEAARREQCDVRTPRQPRRKLEATRSAEQLPATALATSGRPASESTVVGDTLVTRGPDALSVSLISTRCRNGGGGNGSSSSGNGYDVFDDVNGNANGGHPAWLRDCARHRNDVSRSDSCGGDHSKFVAVVGGPGASNSVPRGMSLCTAKSSPIVGLTTTTPTYNYQTASDMAALGGAMTSSAGFCITCSGPSPKHSLSSREDDCEYSLFRQRSKCVMDWAHQACHPLGVRLFRWRIPRFHLNGVLFDKLESYKCSLKFSYFRS